LRLFFFIMDKTLTVEEFKDFKKKYKALSYNDPVKDITFSVEKLQFYKISGNVVIHIFEQDGVYYRSPQKIKDLFMHKDYLFFQKKKIIIKKIV
jgi:hypothetical protein